MTRDDFHALLTPLVIALRAEFDMPTFAVYWRALEDVPAPLFGAAVNRAMKSCRFMPKPGELREFAEDARQALIASMVFTPCAVNEGCSQQGFVARLIDGVPRMVRCQCWLRLQEQRQALGGVSEPLVLPAPADWQEV